MQRLSISFAKSFWFLNTARGKSVVTDDFGARSSKWQSVGSCFRCIRIRKKLLLKISLAMVKMPESFKYLLEADNVILTPHIAGWTLESKEKLAQIIVDKIIDQFAWRTWLI